MVKNKSNLQIYLLSKGYTLKDLKAEVMLVFCMSLINDYFDANEDYCTDFKEEDYKPSEEERNIIHNTMIQLHQYLVSKVLTTQRMQEIISDKSSKLSLMKARLVEPQSYFYNIIARKFLTKIKTIFSDEKKYYIPELLIIYLIIDMKEKTYNFKKFNFIEEYDFSKLLEIYNRININLKRKNGIRLNTPLQEKTIISKMQYMSLYIVEELVKAKYIK